MWAIHLPYLVFALRTAVNETTGFTPARLFFGAELKHPYDFSKNSDLGTVTEFDPAKYSEEVESTMIDVFKKPWERCIYLGDSYILGTYLVSTFATF